MQQALFLGIDIGTTKIAAVVTDGEGEVQAVVSWVHEAGLATEPGRAEQEVTRLTEATGAVVQALPEALRRRVERIGVTGQMHGIVLLDAEQQPLTPLITWQDGRCLEDQTFLEVLCDQTGYSLFTGYGLATLAWLQRHRQCPAEAVVAATIQDLVVARLCNLPRPVTDPSNAAGWGLFDRSTMAWDAAALAAGGVPISMLPTIRPFGSVAGTLDPAKAEWLGVPAGLPVHVAIGDVQASLLTTIRDPDQDIALTLGTGGQATVLTTNHPTDGLFPTCQFWPYPGGWTAIVAASLAGGAAWAWLVDMLGAWLGDLGIAPLAREVLFEKMNTLGLDASDELVVHPHFLGERHDPSLRGALQGLTLSNATIGALARGLARSIVLNLYAMLPPEVLQHRTQVVGSGNALRRTPLLQYMVEDVFGLPLMLVEGREEAATGAALLAAWKR